MNEETTNSHSVPGRSTTVFTPAAIAQIKSLVAEGKTREQIAVVLGTTPASLAGTCSKLGISLRPPPEVRAARKPHVPKPVVESNVVQKLLTVEKALQDEIYACKVEMEKIQQRLIGLEMARRAIQDEKP